MTKKKPSPQNRIWEKERRERLNKTFDSLARLLPDYEPATGLSKIEILQRAIELIEGLQQKVQAFLQQQDDLLRDHVDELEERLRNQQLRNEDLSALLRKANISVPPPCKYDETKSKRKEKKQTTDDELKQNDGAIETCNHTKDVGSDGDKQGQAVIDECEREDQKQPAAVITVVVSATTQTTTNSTSKNTNAMAGVATGGGFSTCFVMTNARSQVIDTTLKPTNGCGVTLTSTPTLLPAPVMATSVLISNNGNLLQVPVAVPSASSLLIVGNEDVRAKINLKKSSASGSNVDGRGSGVAKGKRNAKGNKFTIKSIDVIPGRIVNGKIPIPPLRTVKHEKRKLVKPKKKRKTTATAAMGTSERNSKKVKRTPEDDSETEKDDRVRENVTADIGNGTEDNAQLMVKNVHDCPRESIANTQECKAQEIEQQQHSHQNVGIDINLNQTELSEDIFANLQVPDDEVPGSENQGSLSPSAAYLITFPLVAGGGKGGANHVDAGREESEEADNVDAKKETGAPVVDGSLILENFSSFFSYGSALDTNIVGNADGGLDIPITTAGVVQGASTNFSTIYQSIDNMLEHRTTTTMSTNTTTSSRITITAATDNVYVASTPFTFTLTPTSSSVNTVQSVSVSAPTSVSSYKSCNIPSAAYPTKPTDGYSLKPSIEFTFSLTSTTASQPRTVQSQYTNSAILAPTITTPSYDTYGYYHKAAPKSNSFCPSFGLDAGTSGRLVQGEKPATSFTFSLTSSTRTLPTYTQSSLPPTASASNQLVNSSSSSNATTTVTLTASKHGKQKYQTFASITSTNGVAHGSAQVTTQSIQSKYDVPWMASQDFKTSAGSIGAQTSVPSSATSYDFTQMLPPALDFVSTAPPPSTAPVTAPAYHSNFEISRKSDIFFAHPPGEENLTWSPSKLSNILNDTSSPYFPPATTLPNLNGDLALNTIGASGATQTNGQVNLSSCKLKKPTPTGGSEVGSSTFLSVRQLVDQSTKTYPSCSQKTFNNNSYSAEALIAGSNSSSNVGGSIHVPRKDKYYDGTAVTPVAAYGSSCSIENASAAGTSLSFNFDYSTAEYNKNGYNFGGSQQGASYGSTFMDTTGYTGTGTAASSGNGNYYTTDIGRKATQSYYHQPPPSSSQGYHIQSASVPTENIPYYHLPTNDKKVPDCGGGVGDTVAAVGGTTPGVAACLVKSRKHHTKPSHHLHDTVSSVSSSYFSVLPPPPVAPPAPVIPPPSQSHNRAEESSIYPNYHNFHAVPTTNSTTVTTFNYQYNTGGSSGTTCSNQQLPAGVFHENGRGLNFQQEAQHRHHQHHHQHHNHNQNFHQGHDPHHGTAVSGGGGSVAGSGSLANFNLSTICPEISEKTVAGHVRPAQVASITAHW